MIDIKYSLIKFKGHGFVVFLAFILSVCAIVSSAYVYYQALQAKTQLDLRFNDLSNQYNNQLNANSAVIQDLKLNMTTVQDSIIKLNVATNVNKSKLIIYQLSELVNMANQALLVYNDIKSTIRLLEYAKEILNINNDAQLVDLKFAVAKNLEQLNQIEPVDTVTLVGRLDAIMNQAQNLPIYNNDVDNISKINANNVQNSQSEVINNQESNLHRLWCKFWNNVKTDIALIIKITTPNSSGNNDNNTQKIVVLPAEEIILRQNIQLYLLNARMALLQKNQESWRFNIENATNCFKVFFATSQSQIEVVSSLKQMSNINIVNNSVNLNDTLKALNNAVNLLK